jgi:hypothetical protein
MQQTSERVTPLIDVFLRPHGMVDPEPAIKEVVLSSKAVGANDWCFAGTNAAGAAAFAAFIPMPIFGQAADESFIDRHTRAVLSRNVGYVSRRGAAIWRASGARRRRD